MKATDKLKSISILPGNGAKEIKQVQSEVDDVLENAKRLNDAVWDLVMESKTQLYNLVSEAVTGSKGVRKAYNDIQNAWADLAKGSKELREELIEVKPTKKGSKTKSSKN